MRRLFPYSLILFAVTLGVFFLQLIPIVGIFLMFMLAMAWSIFLVNAGMIGVALEAALGQVSRWWLFYQSPSTAPIGTSLRYNERYRTRDNGRALARLLADLPQDKFMEVGPRALALYAQADAKHWLWETDTLKRRLRDLVPGAEPLLNEPHK